MAIIEDYSAWPITAVPLISTTPLIGSTVIDAANESADFVFRAPRTGTIIKIGFSTVSVTSGATIDVRLESVSAGFPGGTLFGTNTNASQVIANSDDNVAFEVTLTAGASVTKGDKLAIVIKNPASSFGNMQISKFNTAISDAAYPAQAGARVTGTPNFWIVYSDSPTHVPIMGVTPVKDTITTSTISTSSTPDVIGAMFRLPVSRRLKGAFIWWDLDGACAVKVVSAAYHQANNTGVLATASVDETDDAGATGRTIGYAEFAENPTLAANTWYRLIVEPTTTTALSVYDFNLFSADVMKCWATDFMLTTAKDPTADGDWTNYNSGTFRIPFMWLLFDGVDIPAIGSSPILGRGIVR